MNSVVQNTEYCREETIIVKFLVSISLVGDSYEEGLRVYCWSLN